MRIIAGKYKGRRIELPKEAGSIIRPTSDFARQAIFNILIHGAHGLNGHTFEGKNVLDLFCGTGAFGLEALSRGARHVTFIDNARESLATARHNIERIQEGVHADFIQADATQLGKAKKPYDLIFIDPPYYKKMLVPALKGLLAGGWIAEEAILVVEHDEKETLELPTPFVTVDQRKYGRAVIELLQLQ
jgi:16S rRNA (guanine966-N2)-methyltransferase